MTDEGKILLLTDIIEQKVRKEKELDYYQKQLEELQQKMWFIKKEIDLTNMIMSVIENEAADLLKLPNKKP
jgi:hypothetical protein